MLPAPAPDLTYEQKALVRLAADPLGLARVYPRLCGYPSGPPEESPLLFSLKDDSSFAPTEKTADFIYDLSGGLNALDDIIGLGEGFGPGLGADVKRNLLQSILKESGRPDFSNRFFDFHKYFIKAVADFAAVENTSFQPFRRTNLESCYNPFQYGSVDDFIFADADPVRRVVKKNCGNKYCPWCGSRRRKRLAADYMAVIDDCVVNHGLKKTWSLVFSLPEEMERMLLSDAVALRPKIAKLIRNVFECRSRDNLGIIITIHPVGSSDLMRPRLHFHAVVVPLVIDKSGLVSSRDLFSLPVLALQRAWKDLLGGQFEVIPPEAAFYQVDHAKGAAQFHHRLLYDLRSFSVDFENSVLLSSKASGEVILKCTRSGSIFWRCLPIEEIAAAWCRCVDANRVQPFGWLKKVEKLRELEILSPLPVVDAGIVVASAPCVIEIVRRREYDPMKKKMVWVRAEFCHIDGMRLKIGDEIEWA
jgi:hypothetical protein